MLDTPENKIEFRPKDEGQWGKWPNDILNKHPFLCGYLFLSAVLVISWMSGLSMFIISFLFVYLISDFLTNDVRKYIPFLPKALLFSILYITVILLIILFTQKVAPDFVKKLPEVANKLQTEIIKQYINNSF